MTTIKPIGKDKKNVPFYSTDIVQVYEPVPKKTKSNFNDGDAKVVAKKLSEMKKKTFKVELVSLQDSLNFKKKGIFSKTPKPNKYSYSLVKHVYELPEDPLKLVLAVEGTETKPQYILLIFESATKCTQLANLIKKAQLAPENNLKNPIPASLESASPENAINKRSESMRSGTVTLENNIKNENRSQSAAASDERDQTVVLSVGQDNRRADLRSTSDSSTEHTVERRESRISSIRSSSASSLKINRSAAKTERKESLKNIDSRLQSISRTTSSSSRSTAKPEKRSNIKMSPRSSSSNNSSSSSSNDESETGQASSPTAKSKPQSEVEEPRTEYETSIIPTKASSASNSSSSSDSSIRLSQKRGDNRRSSPTYFEFAPKVVPIHSKLKSRKKCVRSSSKSSSRSSCNSSTSSSSTSSFSSSSRYTSKQNDKEKPRSGKDTPNGKTTFLSSTASSKLGERYHLQRKQRQRLPSGGVYVFGDNYKKAFQQTSVDKEQKETLKKRNKSTGSIYRISARINDSSSSFTSDDSEDGYKPIQLNGKRSVYSSSSSSSSSGSEKTYIRPVFFSKMEK